MKSKYYTFLSGFVIAATVNFSCKKQDNERFMAAGHVAGELNSTPNANDSVVAPPATPPATPSNPTLPPPASREDPSTPTTPPADESSSTGLKVPAFVKGVSMEHCNSQGLAWILTKEKEDGTDKEYLKGVCGDPLADMECTIEEFRKLLDWHEETNKKFDTFLENYKDYTLYNCSTKDGNTTTHWLKVEEHAVGYAYFTYIPPS